AGRESGYVDRVVVTRIGPPPGQVVDGYVQMPDTRRYADCARPEHLYDAQVLHPVLGPEDAERQSLGKWGIHDQSGCELVLDADVGRSAADVPRALGEAARGEHGASRDYDKRLGDGHCRFSFRTSIAIVRIDAGSE